MCLQYIHIWVSRNADKINAWADRNRELLWWRFNQWCALWSAICLETSGNTFRCEVPFCFAPKSSSEWIFYEWIMSYSRARAVRANIKETKERRFTHLPIDSYLLLNLAPFCDFMSSLCCSLLAYEEAAQASEQSLTKGKKWSAPWLLMHAIERILLYGMLHAVCGSAFYARKYVDVEEKTS